MRTAIVILIQQSAPQRPQCFADDDIWHSWLRSAHDEGLRIVRRADRRPNAKHRKPDCGPMQPVRYELLPTEHIPYCDGCLLSHQKRMQAQGRCHPCETQLEDADATA